MVFMNRDTVIQSRCLVEVRLIYQNNNIRNGWLGMRCIGFWYISLRLSITYIQSSLSDLYDDTCVRDSLVNTDRHVVMSSKNLEVIRVRVQLKHALTFTQVLLPPSSVNSWPKGVAWNTIANLMRAGRGELADFMHFFLLSGNMTATMLTVSSFWCWSDDMTHVYFFLLLRFNL